MTPKKRRGEDNHHEKHEHLKDSEIGAGKRIGDNKSGTLSDRAGDEGFDDDGQDLFHSRNPTVSEDDDDL